MRTVKFTSDYAGQKKGTEKEYNNSLASSLVHNRKVAKFVTSKKEVVKPKSDNKPVKTDAKKNTKKS